MMSVEDIKIIMIKFSFYNQTGYTKTYPVWTVILDYNEYKRDKKVDIKRQI